jgi:hypothetical protein
MKEEIEINDLILKPDGKHRYIVYYKPNMKCIGSFSMDVDGYYYFWMNDNGGSWGSNTLKMISDALDVINKPYEDSLHSYFESIYSKEDIPIWDITLLDGLWDERGINFKEITTKLSEHLINIKYQIGDISDVGNEVGYGLGSILDNMNSGEIKSFISGFRHGVSLTNGTH